MQPDGAISFPLNSHLKQLCPTGRAFSLPLSISNGLVHLSKDNSGGLQMEGGVPDSQCGESVVRSVKET